ncbi:FAD-binding domain-containing protein [Epithele typhae]|uniref:FAD-binding domain-containing protein n=1 Tax=Epithele typhae TaxID=378194 RepID=UPI0020084373|nr:FAD-binding domain-containing protein [Epithele typhae]KAH9930523.1 FAD-binding domain-containing protein [Epithele typhae]
MVHAQKLLFSALLAAASIVVPASAADQVLNVTFAADLTSSTGLDIAIGVLNLTLGGRVHKAVPFEKPCFSTYEGKRNTGNYTDPTWRVNNFGAYMLPQWETCQSSTSTEGCLLDSANASNPLAINGHNCQLGNIPPYYIQVASPFDVQTALVFSAVTGMRLSVKNKGHDYKGRSSGKGTLSLWMTGLRKMSHDAKFTPELCYGKHYDAITVQTGAFTQDVLKFADSVNRTVIAGYHQTIGFSGGYVLGGGHSILSNKYGLAVDRVVQFKVVTPDGIYRTANECQNKDLFFALRGGGGSAFGVVIESSHKVEPRFPIQAAVLKFTPKASTDIANWYELMVNESYHWAVEGWGGHIVGPTLIHVNPDLNTTEAVASMANAAAFVNARNGSVVIKQYDSYLDFFNTVVPAAQAAVGPELELGTRLIPTKFFNTTDGRAALTSVIKETLPFASPYIVVGTPFNFQATPGATSNEGDVYEPNHEQSYWGDNYAKLLQVKRKYDYANLIDCWQCVGWKGPSDPLYQCHVKL